MLAAGSTINVSARKEGWARRGRKDEGYYSKDKGREREVLPSWCRQLRLSLPDKFPVIPEAGGAHCLVI